MVQTFLLGFCILGVLPKIPLKSTIAWSFFKAKTKYTLKKSFLMNGFYRLDLYFQKNHCTKHANSSSLSFPDTLDTQDTQDTQDT